ncbi:MAG: DNA-directed RNA polymerase subunit B, partial [Candidatus Marsarchaeota archaeon]|nr:DNA-directed RNA polymerase subunit B [Candidatus Marsarchaeota archaeon]
MKRGKEKANTVCYVYLDGRSIGKVANGRAFAEEIRKNRRSGIVSGEINVAYIRKLNEVHINADKGRARKPYIVVEAGASKFTPDLQAKLKSKEILYL